jgi:hypothetical protein
MCKSNYFSASSIATYPSLNEASFLFICVVLPGEIHELQQKLHWLFVQICSCIPRFSSESGYHLERIKPPMRYSNGHQGVLLQRVCYYIYFFVAVVTYFILLSQLTGISLTRLKMR